MTTGGMLHAKFPRGSPLKDFMYSSAEPTLVCRVVSPLSFGPAKVKVKVVVAHMLVLVFVLDEN